MLVQCLMCNELFKLADRSQRQQKKPEGSGNFQKWYFFLVAAFWLYVRCASWQSYPHVPKHPHHQGTTMPRHLRPASHATALAMIQVDLGLRPTPEQKHRRGPPSCSSPAAHACKGMQIANRMLPGRQCCSAAPAEGPGRRFVNTQLAVEITSNRVLAQAVAWIWKGHSPICFLLYTAGKQQPRLPGLRVRAPSFGVEGRNACYGD